MSFTIKFDNLEQISKNLSAMPSEALNKVVPDINLAISKFHNTLETRVKSNYTLKRELGSVQIGSLASSKTSIGLEYELVYKDVPEPLIGYSYKQSDFFTVKNSIPFLTRSGFVKYTPVNKARSVKVNSRNAGSPAIPRVRTKSGRSKFLATVGGKKRIMARLTPDTWASMPSFKNPDGIRAPYKELFGPSLATLAEITYTKDRKMEVARDHLADEVRNALIRGMSL